MKIRILRHTILFSFLITLTLFLVACGHMDKTAEPQESPVGIFTGT